MSQSQLMTHEFDLNLLVVPHEQLAASLSAVVHTILFHRALGPVQPILCTPPPLFQNEFTYLRCSDEAIARLVDERVRAFERMSMDYAMILRVFTIKFQTEVQVKKARILGFLTTESKTTHTWEQWRIPLCVVLSRSREATLRGGLAAQSTTIRPPRSSFSFSVHSHVDSHGEPSQTPLQTEFRSRATSIEHPEDLGPTIAPYEDEHDPEFEDSLSDFEDDEDFNESLNVVLQNPSLNSHKTLDWTHITNYIADACARIELAGLAHIPTPKPFTANPATNSHVSNLPPPPTSASQSNLHQMVSPKRTTSEGKDDLPKSLGSEMVPLLPPLPSKLAALDPARGRPKSGPTMEMPFAFSLSIDPPSTADQALLSTQLPESDAQRVKELAEMFTTTRSKEASSIANSTFIGALSQSLDIANPVQILIPKDFFHDQTSKPTPERRLSASGLTASSPSSTTWPFQDPSPISSPVLMPSQPSSVPGAIPPLSTLDSKESASSTPRSISRSEIPSNASVTPSTPILLATRSHPPPPPPPPPSSSSSSSITAVAQSQTSTANRVSRTQVSNSNPAASALSSFLAILKAGPPQFGSMR